VKKLSQKLLQSEDKKTRPGGAFVKKNPPNKLGSSILKKQNPRTRVYM